MKNKTRLFTLSTFITVLLKFLAKTVRQEEEIKIIQIGEEDTKLFLFVDHLILNLKDPKDSTKKLLSILCRSEHFTFLSPSKSFLPIAPTMLATINYAPIFLEERTRMLSDFKLAFSSS
jgi:hypothetical protein